MTYKASLDNLAKGITIGVTILFAAIIISQYLIDPEGAVSICTRVVLLLIYFGVFAFRPVNYSISGNRLIIHRPFKDIKMDKSQIKSVELLDNKEIKGSVRTFGVGGLFGYFGKFFNPAIGHMSWYATRKDTAVLIQTKADKKIILTPNEPDKFVTDLNQ